jgi:hypothetical protein
MSLIQNQVPYPDINEDRLAWADNVEPIVTVQTLSEPLNDSSVADLSKSQPSRSAKRVATDEIVAKRLSKQLNHNQYWSDEESEMKTEVQPEAKSNKRAKITIGTTTSTTSESSNAFRELTEQVVEQRQQMQQVMSMLQQLQASGNNTNRNIEPPPQLPTCPEPDCALKFVATEKFCSLHGHQLRRGSLPLSSTTSQSMNGTNTRGVINSAGNATTVWNQTDHNITPSNSHNSTQSSATTTTSTTKSGNSITLTINNSTEPTFPFAQINTILPEKVIQDARKGKWVPLSKFLPSAASLALQELEETMTESELMVHKVAQVIRQAGSNNNSPNNIVAISSPFELLQAFGGGLIPAACEGNQTRLADYQLFLLQIISLLRQQQWTYVLSYVEEVRKSKQTSEVDWATHSLAAPNATGIHQEAWARTTARQLSKLSTNNSNNNSNHNGNNPSINAKLNVNNTGIKGNNTGRTEVCRNFLRYGNCRWGKDCMNSHVVDSAAVGANSTANPRNKPSYTKQTNKQFETKIDTQSAATLGSSIKNEQ